MNPRLLEFICCPETGRPLRFIPLRVVDDSSGVSDEDLEEGVLATPERDRWYPVLDGVPRLIEGAPFLYSRFVEQHRNALNTEGLLGPSAMRAPSAEFMETIFPTLRAFEKEWSEHDLGGRTWGMTQETRLQHFLKYMNWTRHQAAGKLVLDAGAGTGQLSSTIATLDCEVIGADLSPAVVRGWKYFKVHFPNRRNLHIVQANLLKPPFREGIFDGVHSSGVLHHMPDTRWAFQVHARMVKPSGSFFVHLYKNANDYPLPVIPFVKGRWATIDMIQLRKMTTRLDPTVLYGLSYLYAASFHFAYKLNEFLRGSPHNQSIKERVTSLFDCLAPPYQWKHTPEEVAGWFREMGFSTVLDTTTYDVVREGFNLTGIKDRNCGPASTRA